MGSSFLLAPMVISAGWGHWVPPYWLPRKVGVRGVETGAGEGSEFKSHLHWELYLPKEIASSAPRSNFLSLLCKVGTEPRFPAPPALLPQLLLFTIL